MSFVRFGAAYQSAAAGPATVTGAAELASASNLAAVGTAAPTGAANLSAVSSLTATATSGPAVVDGAAALAGAATLAADSLWLNTLTGIADSVAVTTGNSGSSSGDAFSSVVGTAPTVKTSANLTSAYDRGMEAAVAGATDSFVQWEFPSGDTTKGFVRLYVRIASLPPSTLYLARGVNSGGSVRWDLRITTTGQVVLANAGGGWIDQTAAGVIATGTVYRLEASIDGYDGELRVYEGEGTTPLSVTSVDDASNLGWDRVRVGAMFSAARTFTAELAAPAFSHTRWVDRAATSSTVTGAAVLAAAGSVTAAGVQVSGGAAALSAGSSLAAAGSATALAASSLAGLSSAAAAGLQVAYGAGVLVGAGGHLVAGVVGRWGSAGLSASGSLTAAGVVTRSGAASLAASGALVGAGTPVRFGAASLAVVSSLTAAGDAFSGFQTVEGAAALAAAGSLTAAGHIIRIGHADLAASASALTAVGLRIIPAAAVLPASGLLAATGVQEILADAVLPITALLEAVPRLTVVGDGSLPAVSSLDVGVPLVTVAAAAVLPGSATVAAAASVSRWFWLWAWDGTRYRGVESVMVKRPSGWVAVDNLRQKTGSGWADVVRE